MTCHHLSVAQVFIGDTALTIRPSKSDAGAAEFLVCMLSRIRVTLTRNQMFLIPFDLAYDLGG